MANRSWTVESAEGTHRIELQDSFWGGKRVIKVDGEVVHQSRTFLGTGSSHPIQVGGQAGSVEIRTNGFTFSYDLTLDGRSVTTGKSIDPMQPVPRWGWVFLIANAALIPIGGALGALCGILGARACQSIARKAERGAAVRILLCLTATVGAWMAYLATGTLFVLLRH